MVTEGQNVIQAHCITLECCAEHSRPIAKGGIKVGNRICDMGKRKNLNELSLSNVIDLILLVLGKYM